MPYIVWMMRIKNSDRQTIKFMFKTIDIKYIAI